MRVVRRTNSVEETERLGAEIGGMLRAGDVVLLDGPLGAGKTTLTRAIARGMGIDAGIVSSPTFVMVNEYPGAAGGPDLVHIDAYRLGGPDDLDAIGWDRLVDPAAGVAMVVEWAERIAGAIPAGRPTLSIRIQTLSPEAREFAMSSSDGFGRRGAALARAATTCPVTGAPVAADTPTWPFADERARMADLYRWLSGSYQVSRPLDPGDEQDERR